MITLKAWIDGACEPNPGGVAAYGVIVKAEDGYDCHSFGIVGEGTRMSNNVAEYGALIILLEMCRDSFKAVEHITIYSDSEMLVSQMNGTKESRKGLYLLYSYKAVGLARVVGKERLSFIHIPREQNTEADTLSKEAIRRYRDGR